MYEMKEEYYIGIPMIDEEHARLFEIAREAYDVYKDLFIPDKYDHVKAILNELRDYTKLHFEHEEEYMRSIGYKKMFTQVMEHRGFIKTLDEFDLERIDENSDSVIEEILTLLTNWLIEHILDKDKEIGK